MDKLVSEFRWVLLLVGGTLAGCGISNQVLKQPEPTVEESIKRTTVNFKTITVDKSSATEENLNCSLRVPRIGSDLAKHEATIREDLKAIGKSEIDIETYIAKWRCETNYLRN